MITLTDINLVRELENLIYVKSMEGVVSPEKQASFKDIKNRLRTLSDIYKNSYNTTSGKFESETAKGNPISYHGKLRRVWSGIFKGASNKQYSGQISFVINTQEQGLDVGFYFGRASSFNIKKDTRIILERELKILGQILYEQINNDLELKKQFYSLFDLGFKAEIRQNRVTSDEWLENLIKDPTYSSITITLKPNENGLIESSAIDLYVAMVMPLISVLPENISNLSQEPRKKLKPLTAEQRAKQAERRSLIGTEGENVVFKHEVERLKLLDIIDYPKHQSLISDSFGYDILSCDNNKDEIFIEVKTTTLLKEETRANLFYISSQEYKFYKENEGKYRLYRVYDIYGSPIIEEVDLSNITPVANSYIMEIQLN